MFKSFRPRLLCPVWEKYESSRERDKLAAECRKSVVEWRWASGDMSRNVPFRKERFRHNPQWIRAGAKPKPADVRHGLDATGAIRIVENGLEKSTTYIVHGSGPVDSVQYTYRSGDLEYLRRCVYDGERIVRVHNLIGGRNGSEEVYVWKEDQLDHIISLGWSTFFNSDSRTWRPVEKNSHAREQFEYDDLGRLDRIVACYLNSDGSVDPDLGPRIAYERPKKAESIPALAKEIQRMLLEQVPAAVVHVKEKAQSKGPFYCLLLCYCAEDFEAGWPPFLVLASEAERRRIVEEGQDVRYWLWAPDELREMPGNVEFGLRDVTLRNQCRLHARLMGQKDDTASGIKVLRAVAKELNAFDWSKTIDVTPDFLVAAVDNTGEVDAVKDIKAVVPAAVFRSLKKNDLV
jgi:hypothetical protein